MQAKRLMHAIDAIYEAPGHPESWPIVLQKITDVFDHAVGSTLITKLENGSFTTVVSPLLIEAQREYDGGWWRQDFLTQRAMAYGYYSAPGNILTENLLATPDEIASHPFFTEFRHRHGISSFMAGVISPAPNVGVYLVVQRRFGAPPFEAEALEFVEWLLRHCERALTLDCRLEHAQAIRSSLFDSLARMGAGVMLFDRSGLVTACNSAAEILLHGGGMKLVAGRPTPTDLSARYRLDEAMMSVLRGEGDPGLPCPRPVIIPRGFDQRPLVAYILPLRTDAAARIWHKPAKSVAGLVLLTDTAHKDDLDPALVRDYLGVTLSEARVAAQIGRGNSPRAAASCLGITEATVRTTLKRVFSKTGVSRQSELAVLISRLGLFVEPRDHS